MLLGGLKRPWLGRRQARRKRRTPTAPLARPTAHFLSKLVTVVLRVGDPGAVPSSGEMARRPSDMRASDADREQIAERLRCATDDGRLLAHEFDERLDRALQARTYTELDAIVADLPRRRVAVKHAGRAGTLLGDDLRMPTGTGSPRACAMPPPRDDYSSTSSTSAWSRLPARAPTVNLTRSSPISHANEP